MSAITNDYIEVIKPLPLRVRLSYGIGHVLNDVCASMWFTYLLVYFHLVLEFSSFLSGIVLLVGQVADALSTPFVGIQSDRIDEYWLCKYGRRKTWHLVGTLCVLGSFPFIFSLCINCENSHEWAQVIYYSAFVIIFQFGWASVQISHLSLIPELTPCEHERTSLTAIRYSFTVISNIFVYVIMWGVFHMTGAGSLKIGPKDASKFQLVVGISIGVGALASGVFHFCVKETNIGAIDTLRPGGKRSIGFLLKNLTFYQLAMVYMASRLFVNLAQVYIPLYLHESLNKGADSLAIMPLVMYISSFVISLAVKPLNKHLGRKISYFIGATIGIAACVWLYCDTEDPHFKTYYIYIVVIMLGAASSILLVTSLGITADFIGFHTERCAFVYGSMSFTDKLSNGIAVAIIQYLKCPTNGKCDHYYSNVLGFVCGGAAAFGLINVLVFSMSHLTGSEGKPYQQLEREEIHSSDDMDPVIQERTTS